MLLSDKGLGWVWWHMLLIPAFRKQRQEDLLKFEDSLVFYTGVLGPPGLHRETVFQKENSF